MRRTVSNALASKVEDVLRPLVGGVLASVSVDLESKRIGKTTDTITIIDLPRIADNISDQLRLVVGPDLAEAAGKRVRGLA